MAKDTRKFAGVAGQGELFGKLSETPVLYRSNAPCLDVWPELLGAIKKVLREAMDRGLSRDRVVDRMNLCLPELVASGKKITKRQLDCWTANSKQEHKFPLEYLSAFCWAVESDLPMRILVNTLGFELVDAHEVALKRLGETYVEKALIHREQGALLRTLGSQDDR